MSPTWHTDEPPPTPRLGAIGWGRVALRGGALTLILLIGAVVLSSLRLIERPLCGLKRPVTPTITRITCRACLLVLGLTLRSDGLPMGEAGAVVCNHASWLDIIVLNARKRIYFVAKSEVVQWPIIGGLARLVGTVFISRDPRAAGVQKELFEARLLAGHTLLFFPEGTSSDGLRVLPFKSTLFQALFSEALRPDMHVQPVTLVYQAPPGQDARFYGWWGDMSFASHMLQVLGVRRHGKVRIVYHAALRIDDFANRKALAHHAETVVRAALPPERQLG